MANIKNLLIWGTLSAGIIAILFVGLILIDEKVAACQEGHVENQDEPDQCYYQSTKCEEGEVRGQVNNVDVCVYEKTGFLNLGVMKFLAWFFGGSYAIFFAVAMITWIRGRPQSADFKGFRDEDRVHPKRAKELFAMAWSEAYNITRIGKTYKRAAFRFFGTQAPATKGDEYYLKFMVQIKEGSEPGIYTVEIPLSRGEDYILTWNFEFDKTTYHEKRTKRDWNVYAPADKMDRLLDQIGQQNPERALRIAEDLAVRQIKDGPQQPQDQGGALDEEDLAKITTAARQGATRTRTVRLPGMKRRF